MPEHSSYPPIGDYALISDCFSTALVSRSGSIDWCCMPRIDSDSCFGRLLDWERGGFCSISPEEDSETFRSYMDDALVLETRFKTGGGEARLLDCSPCARVAGEALVANYCALSRVSAGGSTCACWWCRG